jgi:EmrB/QacA subfamily drug resistance transporter
MELLDGTIINTSLPSMATSFQVQPVDLSIGITAYLLATAMFVPLSGWLADRHGSRTVFLWSIGIFTLGSLACGLVVNLGQFTFARAVQGFGGALMMPVGRIVVLRNTEKSDLLRATALITWPALLAPVIAPVLGGFITTYTSWRWNFLLNVPLGLIGAALTILYIPQIKLSSRLRFDWTGLAWTSTALIAVLYGLDEFSRPGENWRASLAVVLLGMLLATLAVRHLRRSRAPLIDLSPLRLSTFALSALSAGGVYRVAISATPFLLPLMFQVGLGWTALKSGEMVLIYFFGNLIIKPSTTPILRRFGFRTVLIINGLLGAIAMAACASFSTTALYLWIAVIAFLAGATRSMQFTALNTVAFADITPAQRSSAATLASVLTQTNAVLGVSLAAILLEVSQWLRHANQVSLADFQISFLSVGLLATVAALYFRKLERNAGAEVSGFAR